MVMTWVRRHAPPSAKRVLGPLYMRVQLAQRGDWPYLVYYLRRRWTTRDPETLTEKIRYKMIRDRRRLLTTFADKVATRDYVEKRIGPHLLTTTYAVGQSPSEIDWEALPPEYACKASHGGGGAVIVWRGADPEAELPTEFSGVDWAMFIVHPDKADPHRISALSRYWLEQTYGWGPGTAHEWAYKNVKPRILVEELLTDEKGRLPHDYRFFVFHGKNRFIQVETNFILDDARRDFFWPDWTPIPVQSAYPRSETPPSSPPNLSSMIAVAEQLGQETDFLRVDLYNIDGRIAAGELTNYPVGGNARFDPPEYDKKFGAWWTVPKTYRSLPAGPRYR